MSKSKIILYFCLSFVAGVFLSSFLAISQIQIIGFLILVVVFVLLLFYSPQKIILIGFCLLFLAAGIWRCQQIETGIKNNELRKFNDKGKIVLIGIVNKEPIIKEGKQKLVIQVEEIRNNKTIKKEKPLGKVLVLLNRYPEYKYGDKLEITGFLKTPPVFEEFNYRDYLKKDGIYSVMNFPKVQLIGSDFGNPIYKLLFVFKNKFKETTQQFIPPPQEGILEALSFGDEENISSLWKEKLNITGTRHIAAVSGMNITIISFLVLNFLLLLGFWRQQAFYLTIFLVVFYILMIGAPSSAVRAGIMAGILILAQYLGRLSQAQRALIFAATFMLFLNPLLLKLDIGFQLSFLATLGIIYFQPFLSEFFKKVPDPKLFPLRATISTTLAAQVFTFPILIYNFGYISLVSLITNTFIVPILAPLTILIFVFGFSGMIFWFFGWLLSLPTWLFLSYITGIIDWFSKLSFASLKFKHIHWAWLIVFYVVLGLITWRIQEKQKPKFLQ